MAHFQADFAFGPAPIPAGQDTPASQALVLGTPLWRESIDSMPWNKRLEIPVPIKRPPIKQTTHDKHI